MGITRQITKYMMHHTGGKKKLESSACIQADRDQCLMLDSSLAFPRLMPVDYNHDRDQNNGKKQFRYT